MDTEFTLNDLVAIVRRRWPLLLAPVAVGAPIALAVALLLPPVYASTARILVESAQIPDELARSTVGQSADERIQLIQQRLLTRQTLLEIADQHGVFRNSPGLSPTEVVQRMRDGTRIESVAGSGVRRGNRTTIGVNITFRAEDPAVAARVANELVTRILQQNVQERTDRASGTLAFFTQEVDRLSGQLEAQAARISAFKNANSDALPETLSFRQSELTRLTDRGFARSARLAALQEERRALAERIAVGATEPGGGLSPEQLELRRVRSDLVAQRAVLAETHPTIRRLAARVEALEASLRGGEGDDAAAPRPGVATEVMTRLEAIDAELALLREQEAEDAARAEALELSIRRTPEVQMALTALERAYSTLETRYRDAVLKQAQAQTGERLEASQQAERFEVVEQAIAPERPASPNRRLIAAAGVIGSGGIGVVLAGLAELLNRSVRSAQDLEQRLKIRPIVSVPYIQTPREIALRRWRTRAIAALALLGAPAALFLVDTYYMPLPVLIERLAASLRLDVMFARLGV